MFSCLVNDEGEKNTHTPRHKHKHIWLSGPTNIIARLRITPRLNLQEEPAVMQDLPGVSEKFHCSTNSLNFTATSET